MFGERYAQAYKIPFNTLFGIFAGIVTSNGLLEAAVAAVITLFVGNALLKVMNKEKYLR
ncbi:MAG: hypothetical protein N2Z65_05435 [Clostridiales bacterium]|nr:hypothetical protein [Clostridiales bacterium]